MIAIVGRNILANVAGTGLGIVVFLAVVPVYLRLLGDEAFGLIGLLTTVMIAATALDFGLGATMNREVARRTDQTSTGDDFADVAATLQAACWAVGLAAGLLFVALAPVLATRWLSFSTLSATEVRSALGLMGMTLPALIVRGFYVAALNGLQRQGLTNLIQTSGILARGAVTIVALQLVAPTTTVFFVTQLILFCLEVAVLAAALQVSLPAAARRGRVRPAAIRPVLAFSAGMAGTMVLGLALTSMDQLILSAILPLAEFGYYTLAVTVATALGQVVRPVTTAIYPRFSQLFERGDASVAADDYHFFSQLVATVVLPLAAILMFFPADVLALWTRNAELVRHAAVVLSLRTVGTVLNALMHVPHVVQLAFGWSTLGARVNAVAILAITPVIVILSWLWGGPGAAVAWIILNLGILLIGMARMHRRVLPGELSRWYGHLLRPSVAVVAVSVVARAAMPEGLGTTARLGWLTATGLLAMGAAVSVATTVRRRVAAARLA
jgi:O-antigen/teichoic acid export membrane protein